MLAIKRKSFEFEFCGVWGSVNSLRQREENSENWLKKG